MHSATAVPLVLGLLSYPASFEAQSTAPSPPRVTGFAQARLEAVGDSALFKLRRLRLGARGQLAPWASYTAEVELRAGGTGASAATVSATDLYVALAHGPWTATIGQSKTPLSIEFIRSATLLELGEFALAVDSLAPNRDVGVKVQWSSGPVGLYGGIFNGDGINRAANRDKRFLYMGRAVLGPVSGAYLGVAAAGKPDTTTWNVEGWADRGPVTIRAEFLARRRSAAAVTTLGWYALGTYSVIPKRLQLVGRLQQYDPDDRADGDRVTGYTGGAQWFLTPDNLKAQLDYTVLAEQRPVRDNNRLIVQLQATF